LSRDAAAGDNSRRPRARSAFIDTANVVRLRSQKMLTKTLLSLEARRLAERRRSPMCYRRWSTA
jgi:hypothetical protein